MLNVLCNFDQCLTLLVFFENLQLKILWDLVRWRKYNFYHCILCWKQNLRLMKKIAYYVLSSFLIDMWRLNNFYYHVLKLNNNTCHIICKKLQNDYDSETIVAWTKKEGVEKINSAYFIIRMINASIRFKRTAKKKYFLMKNCKTWFNLC